MSLVSGSLDESESYPLQASNAIGRNHHTIAPPNATDIELT